MFYTCVCVVTSPDDDDVLIEPRVLTRVVIFQREKERESHHTEGPAEKPHFLSLSLSPFRYVPNGIVLSAELQKRVVVFGADF